VKETDLADYADIVMTKQGRLMANNYVPLDREMVLGIYKRLY
jgi:4-hydroxybutyrate dehydrogenase